MTIQSVSPQIEPVLAASLAGLAGGVVLLVRGLGGYRTSTRIADTAGSRISSVAAGESRITGIVEAAELLLVSPLQSRSCVYYRATVEEHQGDSERRVFHEERAVGFRVRDETGTIRVFPRGARWAIADRFHDHTGLLGEQPVGLDIRTGASTASGSLDRDAAVERLLTVQPAGIADERLDPGGAHGRRSYREARIEPGDIVTLIGFVEPFGQVGDPTGADDATFGDGLTADPLADPAIAADLAEARASGELADTPEAAWGNAAIPGFGIGRPVREPELDPGATHLPLADAATAERIERTFDISPETLVVTATSDVPLLVTFGTPVQAAARENNRFLLGLVGAVVAIASALTLALVITGGLVL